MPLKRVRVKFFYFLYKLKFIYYLILNPLRLRELLRGYGYVDVSGETFRVPVSPGTPVQYSNRVINEKWMEDLLPSLLNSGGVFVDVGAHIGQTMVKVKASRSGCRYVGIEPQHECAVFVEKLIKENKLENFRAVWAAAGVNGQENASLHVLKPAASNSTTGKEFRRGKYSRAEVRSVPAVSVDELRNSDDQEIKKIDVLKIDVEGDELSVVEGSENVLKTDRPYVLMEILPSENPDMHQSQVKLGELMDRNRYQMFRIVKSSDLESVEAVERVKTWPLDKEQVTRSEYFRDYLFIPREWTGYFLELSGIAKQ